MNPSVAYQRNLDERRGAIAQRVVDHLLKELGITQLEIPWGLAPEDRPLPYGEALAAGLIVDEHAA